MANFAFPDLKIELDNATPALQDISKYVKTINGWTVEEILEEITGAGDTTDRWSAIGFTQKNEVVLGGELDDTAEGLFDIMTKWTDGLTRTLQLTFGTGDVVIVEVLKRDFKRLPSRGAFTQIEATLRPTGAIT